MAVALVTAEPLDVIGREIRTRIERGDRDLKSGEDHLKAAGLRLVEVKKRIAAGANDADGNAITFDAFLSLHGIGRSRAYELVSIASGKTTVAEVRAKAVARDQRREEKNKAARAVVESVGHGHDKLIAAWQAASSDSRATFLEWAGLRADESDVEVPAPTVWVPQPFKMERIGEATVYCGDCRDVLPTLSTVSHLICDPPYEADTHAPMRRTQKSVREGVNDDLGFDAITGELRHFVASEAARLSSGWALFFCQTDALFLWRQAIQRAGVRYKKNAMFIKPDSTPQLSGDKPAMNFEAMALAWCGTGRSVWNAGGKRGTYTHNVNSKSRDGRHKTEKPIGLMRELLNDFTNAGETILDPFMGSGTTGVAALSMDRRFIGIERDPEFFKVACERLHKQLGAGTLFPANDNQASLLDDGFEPPAFLQRSRAT